MKRLFIAIPISDIVKEQITGGILSQTGIKNLPVKWSANRNLHLTLQFLGDVEEKNISVLKQILDRIPLPENIEVLDFGDIGAFPDISVPKVIWLGIKQNSYLSMIQRKITLDLLNKGFSADRKKYHPHLTLGRVRSDDFPSEGIQMLKALRSGAMIDISPINKVILFESQLRPAGPIYSSIYEKSLTHGKIQYNQ